MSNSEKDHSRLPFVLDEVVFTKRRGQGENVPKHLLPRPEIITLETLKHYFVCRARELNPLEFKRFLDYQIANSDEPGLLLEYFEFEYIIDKKAHIESDIAKYGVDMGILAYFAETAKKKLAIIEEVVAKGVNPENNFDSKYFDVEGWKLFNYLVKRYHKKGNVKYINLWFFLKKVWNKEQDYRFSFTQDEYKTFILKKYEIEIKKFAKATYKFDEDEVPYLKSIASKFPD